MRIIKERTGTRNKMCLHEVEADDGAECILVGIKVEPTKGSCLVHPTCLHKTEMKTPA